MAYPISFGSSTAYCCGHKQFGHLESGLYKVFIGAPVSAAGHHRIASVELAYQLLKKPHDSETLPTSFYSRYYRSCPSSSSSCSVVSSIAAKNGFLSWYLGKLHDRPLITKSISTSLIFTLADITAQIIKMQPDDSIDVMRILRMSAYGLLILGPIQHYWFTFLSKVMPQTNIFTTLMKMFIGQAIFAPFMNSVFFSFNAVLKGESLEEVVARLKRDLLPTLKNNLIYWPICDFVTFMFFPVHLQPLINSSFAYLWTIYLTSMGGLKKVGS